MPTSHELAQELRKVADRLESQPAVEVPKAYLWVYFSARVPFLDFVRVMPRPLTKRLRGYGSSDMEVAHDSPALYTYAAAPQSVTCTLVKPAQPAVYECEPLLSDVDMDEAGV